MSGGSGSGSSILPSSSVLDRVKAFLPQLQQANAALEVQIREGGADSVRIDMGLAGGGAGGAAAAAEGVGSEEGEEETSVSNDFDSEDDDIEREGGDGEDDSKGSDPKGVISLEFALGDFDDSIIAKLEDEKKDAPGNEDSD